jgi:hypothetical protein
MSDGHSPVVFLLVSLIPASNLDYEADVIFREYAFEFIHEARSWIPNFHQSPNCALVPDDAVLRHYVDRLSWIKPADSIDLKVFWEKLLEAHGFESDGQRARRVWEEICRISSNPLYNPAAKKQEIPTKETPTLPALEKPATKSWSDLEKYEELPPPEEFEAIMNGRDDHLYPRLYPPKVESGTTAPPEQPERMKLLGPEAWDDTPTSEELEKYQDEPTPQEWARAFSGKDDHLYPRLAVKQEPAQGVKKVLPSSPPNSTKHCPKREEESGPGKIS